MCAGVLCVKVIRGRNTVLRGPCDCSTYALDFNLLTNWLYGRHLIADHLGWFKESTEEGTLKTVEDLMRAKGERVRRGATDGDLTIEYAPPE